MLKNVLPLCFSIAIVHILWGQPTDPIVPDRPGLGESAYLVPKGIFQIESGVNIEWDRENGIHRRSYTYNATTLRFGISGSFELRAAANLQQDYLSKLLSEQTSELGLTPWSLGFKTRIAENKGWIPRTALLGNLAIPYSASPTFRTSYIAPSFLIPMEWDLSDQVLLTINTGAFWDGENAAPAYFGSFGLDYVLRPGLGIFIESYMDFDEQGSFLPGFDAGVVWRLTPDIQLDLSTGIGLNPEMADGFLNGGVSYRIGRKREANTGNAVLQEPAHRHNTPGPYRSPYPNGRASFRAKT